MSDPTPPTPEPQYASERTDAIAPTEERPASTPALSVEALVDPSVNFAALHNDIPAIKRLTLANTGDTDAEHLELRLWVDRELSGVWTHRLDRLAPGRSLTLNNIALPLRAEPLAHITERDSADLHCEVRCGESVALKRVWPIDVLAFDEWEGIRALPELLAAFVTPNHPAIERLLGEARLHLERATGDGALSGYQRKDPARVRTTVDAIYRAVGDLNLAYINPPASFEQAGQRVRLPDQVLERRMGTCFDLTLLLAALFEQAGLHPLVVMVQGHAFIGVWLGEERFPEPAVTEPLRLRKRVQLGEVLVIETTGLTQDPAMSLGDAQRAADRRLDHVEAFHYAVDVRTARLHRIRPLPLRVKPGTYDLIDMERAAHNVPHEAPRVGQDELTALTDAPADTDPDEDAFAVDLAESSTTNARLSSWKRKLLDLSLRNRVLNHRETKKTIPLEVPDPALLEDRLAEGTVFNILPRAELMAGDDPRSAELHEHRTGENARTQYLAGELNAGRLYADLTENELDKRLVEVYRAARLGLEESGANTLYLALGFLSWYESPTSEPARLAPILLLPAGLERLPAGRGYRLALIDEDPRVNVTLLEKLRTEYDIDTAGLEELTEDQAGLDVPVILRRFREVVKDIPRWDVLERVDLGLFSFNKFLMWRDLHERSTQLAANPVVRRLVDPSFESIGNDNALPDPSTLDETYRPDQTLCPMDADSSQLAAVYAADEGHSFVLEGPPGTGKSQTITNLIAHALSQGKRVLFVSEKRAALEVVHRRLEKIGLGPFSLELHSNKANKRAVLDQLGEALSYHGEHPPEQWAAHADDLLQTRSELNTLVQALHREHPIGLSLYQTTGELLRLRDTPSIDLRLEAVRELTVQQHSTMSEAIDRLTAAAHAVGVIDQHPYRAANVANYTAALPDQLRQAITPAEEALEAVGDSAASVLSAFSLTGVTPAELSSDAFSWLLELGALLASPHRPTPQLLIEPDFDAVRSAVAEQVELGRSRDSERDVLMQRYDDRIFKEDLEVLRQKLSEGMAALPVLSWFKCYGPRKQLKLCLRPGASLPSGAAVLDDLDALIRVRDWTIQLASESNAGSRFIGTDWLKGEARWDEVLALLDWAGRYRQHFDLTAAQAFGDESARRDLIQRLAIDDREAIQSDATTACLHGLLDSMQQLDRCLATLDELMLTDKPTAWGESDEPGRLDTIASTLEAWRQDTGLLRDWTHWCAVRDAAQSSQLGPLITAHRARVVPAGQLHDVFQKSLLTQWHAAVLANEPSLAGFHRLDHERLIGRFRAIDEQYLELSAEQVRAELSKRLPLHDPDAHANSEVGILNRQLKLKRRHMPVRRLIASLPNLLPRLKPCFLMSPLSVAQYLDTAQEDTSTTFDLVVFDEASQIPVWDAVGALGRGASCVVVGDSKQLPPTNFFQKLESEDDSPAAGGPDENDFVELESILDECSASGLPSMRLLWHYRSRHESLIAFSNAHYYEHRLNTFPSPADESEALGVTLRHIDGTYDRGDTRTNRKEAEALVADVVERLLTYDKDTYRSIGVVTFSLAQQTLIEDLLDQARRDKPAIETFFTDAVDEPVFVKNLENVQGDERAAIYFSVCYGPDDNGKVAMNFGPLNREGGERRLNVAVTRARERVKLYSSLRADQIDLSRTQAVGVAHLRSFLDYAERGAAAIIDEQGPERDLRPTPIDQALAQALRDRGHDVDLHVGLSGYRVTLAVRDTDQPDAYLLGIELDGPIYENAATARDRDRTRPSVMRGLGWRLHRVWALDFLHDQDKEIQRIEEEIERAKRGEAADTTSDHPMRVAGQTTTRRPSRRSGQGTASVYEPFVPSKPEGDAQAYYNEAKTARVRKTLIKIAKREAPLHQDLLAKRLTLAWQVGRLTSKAAERAARVIDEAVAAGELKREGRFVWLAEQDPERYDKVRVPADGDDAPRDIDEVPPQELEQAVSAVLRRTIAIPREDLMREVAELFGLSRLTPRVQPITEEAVQSMLDRGRCVIDGTGKVALP